MDIKPLYWPACENDASSCCHDCDAGADRLADGTSARRYEARSFRALATPSRKIGNWANPLKGAAYNSIRRCRLIEHHELSSGEYRAGESRHRQPPNPAFIALLASSSVIQNSPHSEHVACTPGSSTLNGAPRGDTSAGPVVLSVSAAWRQKRRVNHFTQPTISSSPSGD
jgi:hypothetical protein